MGRVEVQKFLKDINFLADDLDIAAELEKFREDIVRGLSSENNAGMLMLPTYLTLGERVDFYDPVIVMDAGGTNFRICLAHFMQGNNVDISKFYNAPMPGTEEEISADEFYQYVAERLEPYLEYSHKIAFCFSYACEMQPDHDGRIIQFTKEVRIRDAYGTYVGKEIKKILSNRGHDVADLKFVLLNDTVAALLGGFSEGRMYQYSGFSSLVLGTGLNAAYIEKNENIKKFHGKISPLGSMAINMEAGGYIVSNLSDIDLEISDLTNVPNAQIMEKKISGKYQGLQVLYTIREAILTTNLFSEYFKEHFAKVNDIESADINDFLAEPYGTGVLSQCCANELDRENVYYIIDNILEVAAKLVTVLLAGIHLQTGAGRNPVKPLAVTVEGVTYYKSKTFREKLDFYIKSFINKELGYYNSFLQVENANIIGSALAALMN